MPGFPSSLTNAADLRHAFSRAYNSCSMTSCTICGANSSWMARHPEGDLYRCSSCTHCFSDPELDDRLVYPEQYFEIEHKRWFEHPNTALFAAIASNFPKGASVFDAGMRTRRLSTIRSDNSAGSSLAGIDLSANREAAGIRFFQGDFMEATVDERFDAVVSLQVIEHIANIRTFVDRLKSMTKARGTITVSTVNESSLL